MKQYKIIFSPTGGTNKVVDAITSSWQAVETIDLTDASLDFNITLEKESLALIAMPSFGGVAPKLALDRLASIKANDSTCVIVAVYGNRAYEDTLVQMEDYAKKAGFKVIAAISAIAEHSIIHEYAAGRPNAKDSKQLQEFGKQVLEKKETNSISLPGNRPYKKAGSALVPKADKTCTSCGLCATSCPAGAISKDNIKVADKTKCIGCMRCVSICPQKARKANPAMVKVAAMAIKKACSTPKENELFI